MVTTSVSLFDGPQGPDGAQGPNGGEMMPITIWVPGICAPAGSKKGFWNKKANRVMIVDDCKRSKPWQSDVKAFAHEVYRGQLLRGPLHVCANFYMPRPKGHFNSRGEIRGSAQSYPISRPDLSKIFRGVEDALTGVIWADDAQIIVQHLRKLYEADRGPGVEIVIREVFCNALSSM
jgi:Holliday junction resolvase RusA-like endonuclease